jgi:hypothetical protein
MALRMGLLNDLVKRGVCSEYHVPTAENLSDLGTKILERVKLWSVMERCGLVKRETAAATKRHRNAKQRQNERNVEQKQIVACGAAVAELSLMTDAGEVSLCDEPDQELEIDLEEVIVEGEAKMEPAEGEKPAVIAKPLQKLESVVLRKRSASATMTGSPIKLPKPPRSVGSASPRSAASLWDGAPAVQPPHPAAERIQIETLTAKQRELETRNADLLDQVATLTAKQKESEKHNAKLVENARAAVSLLSKVAK